MKPQPKRFQPSLSAFIALQKGFPYLEPQDLDHPENAPHFGPQTWSEREIDHNAFRDQPVLVTVHGFAGTPFENAEILEWLCQQAGYLPSRIMLGAHGATIEDFRQASWQEWQAPLEQELKALHRLGYRQIFLLATSTGCTLALELLKRMHLPALQKMVLVAPLIDPYDKLMRLSKWVHHARLLRAIPNDFDDTLIGNWYREIPMSAIHQLDIVTRKVRQSLRAGLKLPRGLQTLVVQSRHDVIIDRRSALLITDRLVQSHVETLFLDSIWHLPIITRRLDPREEAIKNWVYRRVLDFLQRQDLPPL